MTHLAQQTVGNGPCDTEPPLHPLNPAAAVYSSKDGTLPTTNSPQPESDRTNEVPSHVGLCPSLQLPAVSSCKSRWPQLLLQSNHFSFISSAKGPDDTEAPQLVAAINSFGAHFGIGVDTNPCLNPNGTS